MPSLLMMMMIVCNISWPQMCLWRRSGLVVSALDFWSEDRWFKPGLYHSVVSLDKKRYYTLFLSTQVYKWVPVIIMLGGGGNLAMD